MQQTAQNPQHKRHIQTLAAPLGTSVLGIVVFWWRSQQQQKQQGFNILQPWNQFNLEFFSSGAAQQGALCPACLLRSFQHNAAQSSAGFLKTTKNKNI